MNTQLYHSLNTWKDFEQSLISLNKKEKGNAFELLTKYYFQFDPAHRTFYDEVWLFNEVPTRHLEILGLPSQDLGIDLIARVGNEYHAIQCKYHSDKKESVTFREVATFLSLFESNSKITKGYICSSADLTSKNLDKVRSEHISLILSDTWNNLSKDFFESIKAELNKKKVQLIPYSPKPHQEKALNEAKKYFLDDNHNRGKLIFPCGAGKSLTGFWMTQELGANSIIVAVPSLSLVKQTLDVYLREIVALGQKVKWLCICSDEGIGKGDDIAIRTENIGVPCVTDPVYIENWLNEHKTESKIIFTTYQSGRIIAEVSKRLNYSFDLGIFDEAHKTVGSDKKLFSHLLFEENISISKRVFMTATERFYAGSKDDIISMDNEDIYGETFTQMSFKEAIETGLLTDYKVITIDVKRSEIAEFIQENKLVELNGKWKKDTEARSLASMLALRKAMKLFPIHNAVSFHSSIEKAVRNKELQQFITDSFKYDKIDTFTVSGEMPTTKRNEIVREFAESSKALITNARCLTEGVDVPNIDCIVFADPRKSKVDIVQALGRALRKKEGKDWGYVILPVIYDDTTHEIDNENFNEIMAIVRGLASNDERIVEYFKDKNTDIPKKRNEKSDQFQFEVFSDYIDAEELSSQLQIKLWEKLSRFNWMPFEEARKYVHSLKLQSESEFREYWRHKKLPDNIPSKPRVAYKDHGFISMPDFLGYDSIFQEWLPFEEAKIFARKLNLKSEREWEIYANSDLRPLNIPKTPFNVYKKNGFISMPDFLGYESKFQNWLEYEDAKKYVHSLNLKSAKEWRQYTKSKEYNILIPKAPNNHYRNKGWVNFGTWLGTHIIADQSKKFFSYKEAKDYLKPLNLKSKEDWESFKNQDTFTGSLPKMPDIKYRKTGEWKGWPDFLSYIRDHKWKFLPFEDAKKYVHSLNLKSQSDWNKFCKSGNLPSNIPKAPRLAYENQGWISMGDWLGTNEIAPQLKSFMSFHEAREFLQTLNFKNYSEWTKYKKSKYFPSNLPKSPDNVWRNTEWTSWPDFLGYEKVDKEFLDYKAAKEFVQELNLKSQSDWNSYCKSETFNQQLPKTPRTVYKGEWENWGEWLGTKTVAPQNRTFLGFEDAKNLVQKMNIANTDHWKLLRKQNMIPDSVPSHPDKKYKNKGWKGWGDWLGTNTIAHFNREYISFEKLRELVQTNGIKSKSEWQSFYKSLNVKNGIPSNPQRTYKDKGWKNWADFLGKS